MKPWATLLLLGVATGVVAQMPDRFGDGTARYNTGYDDAAPWQEQQNVKLPAFPKPEDLREFYVSALATNKYFIDASTLSVGADGVVRYALVVKTSGGATNVSFEGINCREQRWKHYATGHSDGTWVNSRAARVEWRPIENKPINRHHAALSRELFCPTGTAIENADEGRNALRLGKHPKVN